MVHREWIPDLLDGTNRLITAVSPATACGF
jgi:hypothetical protein